MERQAKGQIQPNKLQWWTFLHCAKYGYNREFAKTVSKAVLKLFFFQFIYFIFFQYGIKIIWGGRAGQLVIARLLVQIPALGWAELHVKVSLSKILNPKLLLMCGWHLAWWPLPSVRALPWAGSPTDSRAWLQQKPQRPHKRDKAVTDNGWMDG